MLGWAQWTDVPAYSQIDSKTLLFYRPQMLRCQTFSSMWTLGEDQPVQCVIIQKMIDSIQRENHFDFHQSSDYVMHSYENHVSNSASALWENRNFSTSLWTFRKNFIDDFFFFWNVANLLSFNFNKVEHREAVFAIHWYIYFVTFFSSFFKLEGQQAKLSALLRRCRCRCKESYP